MIEYVCVPAEISSFSNRLFRSGGAPVVFITLGAGHRAHSVDFSSGSTPGQAKADPSNVLAMFDAPLATKTTPSRHDVAAEMAGLMGGLEVRRTDHDLLQTACTINQRY